jgi:N,N-dimethylformamidase
MPLKISSSYGRVRVALVQHLGQIQDPDDWANKTRSVHSNVELFENRGSKDTIKGSCLICDLSENNIAGGLELELAICPSDLPPEGSTILELICGNSCLRVDADENGNIRLFGGGETVHTPIRLAKGRWADLRVALDLRALRISQPHAAQSSAMMLPDEQNDFSITRLHIGGRTTKGRLHGFFDGKAESPTIRQLDRDGGEIASTRWDFSARPYRSLIPDSSGISKSLKLFNGPARAVTSRAWRGQTNDCNERPDLYAAIAFHRDDLTDCNWPVCGEIVLPEDIAPGAYSVILSKSADIDWRDRASFDALPIFVVPKDRRERVALVLPTFSYRAYANSEFFEDADPAVFRLKRETVSKPLHDHAVRLGLKSLYDFHSDGSGVHLATLKRPQMTVRADYISQLQGFAHQFSADLAIVEWLNSIGVAFDLLTDEVLHETGVQAIAGYDVVLTGSHPEYASPELMDAYQDYADRGGNLMYLGGNGFYWSIGVDPQDAALIEVRRRDGVRTWTSLPGEFIHQTDGRPGGLWRNLGRPPNLLFGVGFAAHGYSGDGAYSLARDATELPLGKHLLQAVQTVAGKKFGIAGLEIDRYDSRLGSNPDAMIIAELVTIPHGYVPAVEDVEGVDAFLPDPAASIQKAVKGHIVLAPLKGGGSVFSTGSIRWSDGLADPDDTANVQLITTAVLRDFLAGYRIHPLDRPGGQYPDA